MIPTPPPENPRLAELEPGRMPFISHLGELRIRLRNAILALLVGFVVAYVYKEPLLAFLLRPLAAQLAELATKHPDVYTQSLYFNSVVEPMWVYLSLAAWGGLFLASPIIFHQLWQFIAPGLYKTERRYGVAFAFFAGLLFVAGAGFCYQFVLGPTHEFLLSFASANLSDISTGLGKGKQVGPPISLQPMLTVSEYLGFAKAFLLGFGLIFELPLVLFFMALIGVVTHRSLWKFNRYAVVLAFVVGAILTPSTDWLSQLLMAAPIVVMYNISIVLAYFVTKRREKRQAAFN